MMTDRYEHMRTKFEYKYKLSEFEERYREFSLTLEMEPRLHGNYDPMSGKITEHYEEILAQRQKVYDETGVVDFNIGRTKSRDVSTPEKHPNYEKQPGVFEHLGLMESIKEKVTGTTSVEQPKDAL